MAIIKRIVKDTVLASWWSPLQSKNLDTELELIWGLMIWEFAPRVCCNSVFSRDRKFVLMI